MSSGLTFREEKKNPESGVRKRERRTLLAQADAEKGIIAGDCVFFPFFFSPPVGEASEGLGRILWKTLPPFSCFPHRGFGSRPADGTHKLPTTTTDLNGSSRSSPPPHHHHHHPHHLQRRRYASLDRSHHDVGNVPTLN